MRNFKLKIVFSLVSFLLTAIPHPQVLAQNQCNPKSDPSPFEGAKTESSINLYYYSDADREKGRFPRWCYERIIVNNSVDSQLWIRWRDRFGEIMEIMIGPRSRNVLYQRNLGGDPLKLEGRIDYGFWKGAKQGDISAPAWRSPEEVPPIQQVSEKYPPLVAGFQLNPIFDKTSIVVKMELQSDYSPETKRLTYRVISYPGSALLTLEGRHFVKPGAKFPSVQWVALMREDLRPALSEMYQLSADRKIEFFLDRVEKVQVISKPVFIKIGDMDIFSGAAAVYLPLK